MGNCSLFPPASNTTRSNTTSYQNTLSFRSGDQNDVNKPGNNELIAVHVMVQTYIL